MGVEISREKREEILTILVKIYCEQEGIELKSLEFEEVETEND